MINVVRCTEREREIERERERLRERESRERENTFSTIFLQRGIFILNHADYARNEYL